MHGFSCIGRVQREASLNLGGNTDNIFALSDKLRVFFFHSRQKNG